MWKNLKDWVSSKKAKALLTGLGGIVLGILTKEIPASEGLWGGVALVLGYLGAQGLADVGKSKALVEKNDE